MRLGYLSAAPRVSTRPDSHVGAPRAHVLGVISGFEAAGWQVQRFIFGDRISTPLKETFEQNLPGRRWRTLLADIVRLLSGPVNARIAWKSIGHDVDLVYERLAAFQTFGKHFQRHGVPWILETNSLHFIESAQERKSIALARVAKRIELAAYRQCDMVVCVSNALKDVVVKESGIDPSKVMVMPNAVDTRIFDPSVHCPRRVFDGFTVGFVGYVIEWQGVDLLLHAIAALREAGITICVVIVGEGPALRSLVTLAKEKGLADQVCFVGHVRWDEVPSYIAGFDLAYSGQIPLRAGSMYNSPMKLYEYMAMEIPVVASAYADAISLIEGRGSGFLFDPGDVDGLTHVLNQCFQDRDGLRRLGRLARQEIVSHHSWETRIRHLIPAIESLIGVSSNGSRSHRG